MGCSSSGEAVCKDLGFFDDDEADGLGWSGALRFLVDVSPDLTAVQ